MINLSSNQNTQVEAHEEQVWDVEFNPNGRVFASASADKSVMLFENEGKVDRTLPHKSPVLCISFSPNGKYLASGTEDGMIHVWDLSSDTTEQTPKVEFQAHEKPVSALTYHDDQLLISAERGKSITFWNLMTNKPEKLKSLTADSSFFCLDFDGEFVAAGTADGVIEVWSTSSSGIQGDGDGSPETGEPESGTDTSATAPPQETDAETMDQVAAAPDAEPADAGTIIALTDAGVTLKKDGDGFVIEANCRSAEITDDLLVKLGELPNLRSLILSDTKITDTQLSAVGKLSGMQNLDLRNCPATHKNEHHGRKRIVTIGPKGQAVLRRYLLRPADAYCFTPHDSERIRREEAHSNRGTPISYGNRPGSNRKRKPARKPGDRYTTDSYRRAIHRACDAAFPPAAPLGQAEGETKKEWQGRLSEEERAALRRWQSEHRWSPNRLRHSAGTEIRKRFGLEAAQVVLGHASAEVTQVYAERDLMKAVEVMREVG